MTPEERDQLIEAVQAALIPFKEEIRTELLEPMEARLQARIGGLETRIEGLETRIEGLETRIEGLETRMEGLETRMDGLEIRMDGLETQMGGLETRMEGLETQMGGLKTRMGGLEQQMGDLDKRVSSVNDDILGPFIGIAGRQHQELVERVERLEQAFSGLRSDVQRIERGPVRQLLDAAADTRGRLTTIEQRLAERGVLTTQDVIGTGERWVTWSEYRELETRIRVLEETATSYDILPGGDE